MSTPWSPSTNRIAWTFYDGTTTYSLPVNPESASMPSLTKTISKQNTAAGAQILYEGRQEPKKISFSGVILLEEHFRAFQDWAVKGKQIRITDDLGQSDWVFLKSFSPMGRNSTDFPWLLDYSVEGFVLDR